MSRATRSLAIALTTLCLIVSACSDDGSDDARPEPTNRTQRSGPGPDDAGSSTSMPAAPAEGRGVVASKATPYQAPKPAVAPVGGGAPKVGTCLAETSIVSSKQRLGLGATAPCDGPHAAQVVAVVGLPRDKVDVYFDNGRPLTGGTLAAYNLAVAQVAGESRLACQSSFDALTASTLALEPGDDGPRRVWALQDQVRFPAPEQWDAGDRWAACLAEAPQVVPITGVADVTTATADAPMPVGLQVCGDVTGRRIPCDDDIVQVQEFLQLPIEIPAGEAAGGVATAEVLRRATERCTEALAGYAPDLADDDAVGVFARQVMEEERRPDAKFGVVGQPLAACSVSPTAAKGLGLPALVP